MASHESCSRSAQRPTRLLTKLLSLVAVLALLASACGSSGDPVATDEIELDVTDQAESEADTSDAGSDADASDDAMESDEEMESDDDEPEDEVSTGEAIEAATSGDEYSSPLAEFLGFPTGGTEAEQQVALGRQVEQSVQQCMREQGFEYQAQDVSGDSFFFGGDYGADLSEEEYIDVYGYGISTTFDEAFEEQVDYVDPNEELTAAMAQGEQDAWNLALYGDQPEIDEATGLPIDPETGEPTSDFSIFLDTGGCYTTATTEIYGDFQVLFQLESEFEEIEERFYADPRIVELSSGWAECVAAAGYPFDRPGEPEEEVSERFTTWSFSAFSDFDVEGPTAGAADEAPDDATAQPEFELSTEAATELDEIQEYERAVARVDFDCDNGFREAAPAVQAEYELLFIEENRTVLESARPGG